MRFASIISEVRRDVTSGTARMSVGFMVLTALILAFALADLLTISSLQRQARDFVTAGSATRALGAVGSIDGAGCEVLGTVASVQAAGAIALGTPLRLQAMPSVSLQTYRVTPGFAGILGIFQPQPGGVWMDDGLASVLGAHVGDRFTTSTGSVTVGGIYSWPQDGRDQRLAFAVLLPQPAIGLFDECWLLSWPVVEANDILLRTSQVIAPDSSPGIITQINKTLGTSLDAHQLFTARITRWVAPVLMLMGLALGFVFGYVRRLEYASALHAGQSKADQLLTCALETTAWALPATAAALVTLWAATVAMSLQDIPNTLAVVTRGPLVAFACSLLGNLAACALAREQDLFRLFKNR